MLSNYKAVIFDWDGTLVDTCGLILDAHNHVREYMGHAKWTMEDFLGNASKSAREYYPEVYGERSDEAQEVLYAYVDKHHLSCLKPMSHAAELVNDLVTRNIPIAIVSNKGHRTLQIEVEYMKWTSFFTPIIGAGHAAKDKPHSAPLLMAIEQIGGELKPQDILYVGDTETDLMTAQNTGCDVVFIQSDKPRPDLIEKYTPKYAFNDLKGFYEAVTLDAPHANVAV